MTSPIIYITGAVVLVGGIWYAVSKWSGSGKCLTPAKLDTMLAEIASGVVSTASAREAANVLEKDGCDAGQVKALRNAAKAKDDAAPTAPVAKCPTASQVDDAVSKVTSGQMSPDDANRLADSWVEFDGCTAEASRVRDAVLSKPGWPAVRRIPTPYRDAVLRKVGAVNYDRLFGDFVTASGGPMCSGECSWNVVLAAADYVRDAPSDVMDAGRRVTMGEGARADAVAELSKAADRLYKLGMGAPAVPDEELKEASSGEVSTTPKLPDFGPTTVFGYGPKLPPYLRGVIGRKVA